jgi:nitroreductase
MEFNVDQFNLLIKSRRSLKPEKFLKGKIVPDNVVQQILENARWAPTHGLTQPWQFVVFSGEGIAKLAKFQQELYKKNAGEYFTEAKYKKLGETPLYASHIIALGMKRQETRKIAEIEEIESVACAAQNMMLTATVYGVVAFWGSGGITYMEEAKGFFGLGSEDKLLGYLYLGYPAIEIPQIERKPIQEKVKWVTA